MAKLLKLHRGLAALIKPATPQSLAATMIRMRGKAVLTRIVLFVMAVVAVGGLAGYIALSGHLIDEHAVEDFDEKLDVVPQKEVAQRVAATEDAPTSSSDDATSGGPESDGSGTSNDAPAENAACDRDPVPWGKWGALACAGLMGAGASTACSPRPRTCEIASSTRAAFASISCAW